MAVALEVVKSTGKRPLPGAKVRIDIGGDRVVDGVVADYDWKLTSPTFPVKLQRQVGGPLITCSCVVSQLRDDQPAAKVRRPRKRRGAA